MQVTLIICISSQRCSVSENEQEYEKIEGYRCDKIVHTPDATILAHSLLECQPNLPFLLRLIVLKAIFVQKVLICLQNLVRLGPQGLARRNRRAILLQMGWLDEIYALALLLLPLREAVPQVLLLGGELEPL